MICTIPRPRLFLSTHDYGTYLVHPIGDTTASTSSRADNYFEKEILTMRTQQYLWVGE